MKSNVTGSNGDPKSDRDNSNAMRETRNKKINWTMTMPDILRTYQAPSPSNLRKRSDKEFDNKDKRDELLSERLRSLQSKHKNARV